jgi:iron-sulfur cluster repair protein YtfE (RIC family)
MAWGRRGYANCPSAVRTEENTVPDGFEYLADQHREVEKLFRRYSDSPDDATAREICGELTAHTATEEQVLYPELRRIVDGGDDLADDAEAQHGVAKTLVARIHDSPPDDLRPLVEELERDVSEHIRFEEQELFPAMVESGVDADALGARLADADRDVRSRASSDSR